MTDTQIVDAMEDGWQTALEVFAEGRRRGDRRRVLEGRAAVWRWALERNPHQTTEAPSRLWMSLEGARPVGVLLGVPFKVHHQGRCYGGHWGVDLYVPPSVRGRGHGRRLLEHWRDESPLALGLGITDAAFPLELSLGWQSLPLPPREALALTRRGRLLCGGAGRPVSSAGASNGPRLRLEARWPGGLEAFWMGIRDRLPPHVWRDEPFLAWQFGPGDPPDVRWLHLEVEGALRGVCAFRMACSRLRRKAWLLELLLEPGDDVAGEALCAGLVTTCQRLGVDIIEGRVTAPHLKGWLHGAGFRPISRRDRFIVHPAAEVDGKGLIRTPWQLSLIDSGNAPLGH